MRILHVTDLHSYAPWFRWVAAQAPSYDLVCLTGDMLNLRELNVDAETQMESARALLGAIPGPLALCSGNHDQHTDRNGHDANWIKSLRRDRLWIDGDAFQLSGYRFRCIGWCDPIPWVMQDEIVLMHAPPFGAKTSMVAGGVSFGDEDARRICELNAKIAPRLLLGGHVHSPLQFHDMIVRTITLNPGHGRHRKIPNHMIIDLKEGTAEHRQATASGMRSRMIRFCS